MLKQDKMTTLPEIERLALQRYPIKFVVSFGYDINEIQRLAFIEGFQQAIIDNEPHFAVKGDYCAVCGCDEFWNDNNEEEE